jgi:hypothetical protein
LVATRKLHIIAAMQLRLAGKNQLIKNNLLYSQGILIARQNRGYVMNVYSAELEPAKEIECNFREAARKIIYAVLTGTVKRRRHHHAYLQQQQQLLRRNKLCGTNWHGKTPATSSCPSTAAVSSRKKNIFAALTILSSTAVGISNSFDSSCTEKSSCKQAIF